MSRPMTHKRLDPKEARSFCVVALHMAGLPEADADIVADTLMHAECRGVCTHGLVMLPGLVDRLRKGGAKSKPSICILKETACTATMDGDFGLGQVISFNATNLAISKAHDHGVGCVAVRHSNTFGAAAYYAMLALPNDMIGFATTNANPLMAPWGGLSRRYSNNPLSIAIPAGEERPVVLDIALSVAAAGKIALAAKEGRTIPLGWALDAEGHPTGDPLKALAGVLLPMGEYKGYGLALVMDVLSGVLSDGLYGGNIPTPDPSTPQGNGHFFAAVNVSAFTDFDRFAGAMDRLIRDMKTSRLANGFDRVYIPGEIEAENGQRSAQEGIQLSQPIENDLKRLAQSLGLTWCGG
jgi:LDH2 family malate/lactate/ureidoglycolate dehydrogenase